MLERKPYLIAKLEFSNQDDSSCSFPSLKIQNHSELLCWKQDAENNSIKI